MKQRIKYLATIALAAMLFVPAISGAQKMPKKHKNAPGQEPTFKRWNKGLIEGMELPNFDLVAQDGTETSIHEVLDGKPGFIIFTNEHIFYNYFPPRRR